MARLKLQEDSDDDLPDLKTIVRGTVKDTPANRSATRFAPQSARKNDKVEAPKRAGKHDKNPASKLVPKVKAPDSQPRRQRTLGGFKEDGLLRTPFFETATANEVAESSIRSTPRLSSVRSTPRRTAKKAVSYRPATPTPSGSENEEDETTWCEPESEEEVDDTVIEDDFWDHYIKRTPLNSRKMKGGWEERQQKRNTGKQPTSKAENIFPEPLKPSESESDPLPSFSNLKLAFSAPTAQESDRPSSSYSIDNGAILRFEPPTRSPHKFKSLNRPSTPPPPASPSNGRLASPSKSTTRIPTPPQKQSTDGFWDQIQTNVWNEQHSPRKYLDSPRKKFLEDLFADDEDEGYISPSESPKKRSPSKGSPVKQQREAKKHFEARKRDMAKEFLQELDEKITEGKIAELTQETGGVDVVWNKKLNSTAGRAHWKRESVKVAPGEEDEDGKLYRARNRAHIELAEKVIDDEDRLLNVLAHEFCHLANFMVSGIKDNPHGKEFKAWASKVSVAFRHRNIHVTTKHSYDITYKYIWECISCGHEYKRHSKSIDPKKHGCGSCKSKLVQTKPAVRAGAKPSDYQLFIKENFQRVKRDHPGVALGGLMEVLGREYRERKARASKTESGAAAGVDDLIKELEIITLEG